MAWPDLLNPKKVEHIEAESRILLIKGREMGEMGDFGSVQSCRYVR